MKPISRKEYEKLEKDREILEQQCMKTFGKSLIQNRYNPPVYEDNAKIEMNYYGVKSNKF